MKVLYQVIVSCRLIGVLLLSHVAELVSCQLQPSTMNLVSDSSGPLCAADRATTVFTARSLVDCQRQCSSPKNKCFTSNFYSDTKTCEIFNFLPKIFTSNQQNCQMFRDYDVTETPTPYACLVEAVSYGNDDTMPRIAYISINGRKLTNYLERAFNMIELNVSSCSPLPESFRHFDTFPAPATPTNDSEADKMATYLNGLSQSTVLIGVTCDEPKLNLNQNARSALLAIGVNVTGLQYRGKVSFVTQIGQPAMAVSLMAPPGGLYLNNTVLIRGSSATSEVTMVGLN